MRHIFLSLAFMGLALTAYSQNNQNIVKMNTTLQLTQQWDKTFPKSDKVDHKKVTFKNRYGIELAADMYTPKDATVALMRGSMAAALTAMPPKPQMPMMPMRSGSTLS